MIKVFFVPGTFGTTIEYVLRNFTTKFPKIHAAICKDGSMHSYKKLCHPHSLKENILAKCNSDVDIVTQPYPLKDANFPEIIAIHQTIHNLENKNILIYVDDLKAAELNMLFQYYKISIGVPNLGLSIYFSDDTDHVKSWNSNYNNWTDMQVWELREWLSLLYPELVQEWIVSKDQVGDDFLKISNLKLLEYSADCFKNIIDFCGLTVDQGLDNFATEWKLAQQYILDEFDLLDKIIEHSINGNKFQWKPLNVVAESIIQQRLRQKGFELMCDNLNIFPTDSKSLYKLLYRV